jgi:hypothetical protein
MPRLALAQPEQEWAARYFGSGLAELTGLVLDGSGNVYVTGYCNKHDTDYDYITIKYDSQGNQLWLDRYNGPADSNDRPADIAIDQEGNVYVTGLSVGVGSWGDYLTIKYDPDGNQVWTARYNGPDPPDFQVIARADHAKALVVDSNGNVYVTGESVGFHNDGDYDFLTVKYDVNGNQLWVQRHSGAGYLKPDGYRDYYDCAHDIALDSAGNVYITGESAGEGTLRDYLTIKYSSSGTQLWTRRYHGPDSESYDIANALALDDSGNVCVTGTSGPKWSGGLTTVKYDPNGNLLWAAVRANSGSEYDDGVGNAIATDAGGNVYVTGHVCTYSHGDHDWVTVKYDTHGTELWLQNYKGPHDGESSGNALVLDDMNNVYVAGNIEGSVTDNDYAVLKYDSSGNSQWVLRYDGPTTRSDIASTLAVDGDVIYVAGTSQGPATNDYATVKYREGVDFGITDITPNTGICREVITVTGYNFKNSRDGIIGSSGAVGTTRMVRIFGSSNTYIAEAYGNWSDTQFKFRFGDLFVDNDSDFLRDPDEPLLKQCQDMPIDTYSIEMLVVDYEDVDASGDYTLNDIAYQTTDGDTTTTFTMEDAPAVYLIEPSTIQRSHYCPDGSLVNGIIKIYGWGFGDIQWDSKVYMGTACMYFNTVDALNNRDPIPAFDKTCNGGGKILNRVVWGDLMIKAAVDIPDSARGHELYVWVVVDGKITSDADGYPGVYISDVSTCP